MIKFVQHYINNYKGDIPKTLSKTIERLYGDYNDYYVNLGMKHIECKGIGYYKSNSGHFTFKSISSNINSEVGLTVLFHEIGHGVDYIQDVKRRDRFSSSEVILSCGTTLHKCLKLELKDNGDKIYDFIVERYNKEVRAFIPSALFDTYIEQISIHKAIKYYKNAIAKSKGTAKYSVDEIDRFKIELTKLQSKMFSIRDFNNLLKSIRALEQYKSFSDKYGILIDLLASLYDLTFHLPCHSKSYLSKNLGLEFFAEMYEKHVRFSLEELEYIKMFVPKSVDGFYELIDMIY